MAYVHHNTYQAGYGKYFREQPRHAPTPQFMAKRPYSHKARIWSELKRLGMSRWGYYKLETQYLPQLIHEDEPIEAIVYGHNDAGSAMLVATDRRVVFLDRKPLFTKADEVTYDVVAGVTYGQVGHRATVVLHTRIGDFRIHTMNIRCAEHFRDHVETYCLEHAPTTYNNPSSM